MSSTSTSDGVNKTPISSNPTNNASPPPISGGFNTRTLWPDLIETPENQWVFECKDIIEKIGADEPIALEMKRNMEKCLMYFYTLKKNLNLFDHTYTASCILFYRYWFLYGIPTTITECIHISQGILVTSCKTMENNRPIEAYVKATCEFLMQNIPSLKSRANIDKLKWEFRDKLVTNEKKILCLFGFDLNIGNPKELIEEVFSGYYRFNRDQNLPDNFKKAFPKILQESRTFMVQAVTQPVSLLCDGYTFIALSLIYCGLEYKRLVDKDFKYPKNFFRDRFPIEVTPENFANIFTDYKLLEENFFNLKSNKGTKLQIDSGMVDSVIDEGDDVENQVSEFSDPFNYDLIKSGEVKEEFLNHIEVRVNDLLEKAKQESMKRKAKDPVKAPDAKKPKI
ncbi:Bur2p SKDI_12G2590 [Saccharomyces kudriavzevii IFO 1802]|uniref:BUR2-like protein n=2 Tax=Saccharomyces kudriavzevii (strain ATCC MYA-4449 / AS 2.2408 / CBS 8840 / NBRC 1802 / NCYC 2889) TaxID=226230 RepID=J8QFK1_SACK1|nr:uncharacterized protein SKDI_12G2590 [Saccharomyces kudriavzevii IFO 1802]EJT44284.1 BUR2-like protein [Saccharomyces kudriavzevii IFO 1802]CAI4046460.1 hypothetical protein SKDI_12G2590 [Saccharomyces kudriavzevii IFO 1802]